MTILADNLWNDQLYWWIALISTGLFVLKMLFSIVGGALDHGDFDVGNVDADVDMDLDMDHDAMPVDHGSFSVFTFLSIQSFLAFFMGMGWMGIVASQQWKLSDGWVITLAILFGLFLAALNGAVMLAIKRLHSEARYDLRTCRGRIGRVYMAIPGKGAGAGQVEVDVSGQRKIIRAVSNGPAIASFTEVRVLEIVDGQTLLVDVLNAPAAAAAIAATQTRPTSPAQ